MKNKLIDYFSRISNLSPEETFGISESMIIKKFKKGSFLLKEGQTSADSYFVLEGCIRQYSIVNGEEKTTDFFTEEQWVISLNSLTYNNPANYFWICNEDSSLVVGNEQKAQELFKQFPRFEKISREVMAIVFVEQQHKMTSFMTDSPEQRYIKLLETRPYLFQRIPQYQLASYIGVKPESLSRIRRRISLNGL